MNGEQEVVFLRRENKALRAMIARLEERIVQLEAQLAKANRNSGNSSKPPSSDITKPPTGGGSSSSPRKIGGQPGHPRHERAAFAPDQVDERQVHRLHQCPDCGGPLKNARCAARSGRVVQQIELPAKPVRIAEHRARRIEP